MYLNPCGNCIVRPTCREKCDKMRFFENVYTASIMLSGCFFFASIAVIISIIPFFYLPTWVSWLITFIIFVGSYGAAWFDIIYSNYKDFKEQKKWEKVIIIILAPWLYLSARCYDKVEDYFDLYLYRFNYYIASPYIRNLARDKQKRQVKSNVGISGKIWKSKGNDR